jgi:hypothetical protein
MSDMSPSAHNNGHQLTFVRFSDDRWLFFPLIVILFVFFVLVIIVLRVLRRQAHESDKARFDEPGGTLLRGARYHAGFFERCRADISARRPRLRATPLVKFGKQPPMLTCRSPRGLGAVVKP